MLSQATFPEDMDTEVMVAMDMDGGTMARERLKLNQDILEDMVVMDMDVDMVVMDMDVDIMARGRLMLNQDILEDMVVMAVVMDMEAMAMVDMDIMVKLARACGVPVGRRSGGRLAMTLVATINVIIFFFLFSFLLRRLLFS